MGASEQDRDEAAAVAAILNQVCNAAIAALQPETDPAQRAALAAELGDLRAALEGAPAVQNFLHAIGDWLRGTRPQAATVRALDPPFRRALQTMLEQVPVGADLPSISLDELLAQTTAAVVAAVRQAAPETHRTLAVQLLNLSQRLPEEARPLIENLRALLGGASPERLPPITEEPYRQLWQSARLLLAGEPDLGETARNALLDRLVHNTFFALHANSPELTQALTAALTDLQRQALSAGQSELADFIRALRLRLEGRDASHLVATFGDVYSAAWQRLGSE